MRDGAAVAPEPTSIVQGKETLVRASYELGTGWQARTVEARLVVSGSGDDQVFAQETRPSGESEDSDLDSTLNWTLPPEAVTAPFSYRVEVVECTDAQGTAARPAFPETGSAELELVAVESLQLHLVPVIMNGFAPDTSEASINTYHDALLANYPVKEVVLTVDENKTWNQPVYPDGTGWNELLNDLRPDDAPDGHYYYGLIAPEGSDVGFCGYDPCVVGMATLAEDAQFFWGVSGAGLAYEGSVSLTSSTLVHELGHNLGRWHSPCGNPGDEDPDYPHPGALIGWWGWDHRRPNELVDPQRYTDIMSYCEEVWVSDFTFQGMMDRLVDVNELYRVRPSAAPQSATAYRVLFVNPEGSHWGRTTHRVGGVPENADILDASGRIIDSVIVRRLRLSDGLRSTLLVPEPQPGWHSVEIQGAAPIPFE